MLKSKFGKNIAIGLLSITMLICAVQTNIKAANTSDTYWSFSTFGDKGTRYTDPRVKENTTPGYSNIQNYNGKNGDYIQMYLVDSNKSDFRKRIVKTVTGPGQYSVSSYAYEDRGKVLVRMAFYSPYRIAYSWEASGLWSPDSTKTYN